MDVLGWVALGLVIIGLARPVIRKVKESLADDGKIDMEEAIDILEEMGYAVREFVNSQ